MKSTGWKKQQADMSVKACSKGTQIHTWLVQDADVRKGRFHSPVLRCRITATKPSVYPLWHMGDRDRWMFHLTPRIKKVYLCAGGMVQVVEHLPSKNKDLSPNPSTAKSVHNLTGGGHRASFCRGRHWGSEFGVPFPVSHRKQVVVPGLYPGPGSFYVYVLA
jgi:hypothetical protein